MRLITLLLCLLLTACGSALPSDPVEENKESVVVNLPAGIISVLSAYAAKNGDAKIVCTYEKDSGAVTCRDAAILSP